MILDAVKLMAFLFCLMLTPFLTILIVRRIMAWQVQRKENAFYAGLHRSLLEHLQKVARP